MFGEEMNFFKSFGERIAVRIRIDSKIKNVVRGT